MMNESKVASTLNGAELKPSVAERTHKWVLSDADHEKMSKKELLLLGHRKDRKDKKKERGYATLDGESSPEDNGETNQTLSLDTKRNEFYKCKPCDTEIQVGLIVQHHTKVHPLVPHEEYLDKFFNLSHPLRKCKFCSIKLREKHLAKHEKRAHSEITGACVETMFEISSGSKCDSPEPKRRNKFVDKFVQCDPPENVFDKIDDDMNQLGDNAGKDGRWMKDASVNTDQITSADFSTQTQMVQMEKEKAEKKQTKNLRKRYELSAEIDEDGFGDLIFSFR